jgi:Arc/MetJ-type ribon-helix-helix transcriptional regulator
MGYEGVTAKMGKKLKTSIALDEDLLRWIDQQIKTKRFATRTHAIEYALQKLKESSQS